MNTEQPTASNVPNTRDAGGQITESVTANTCGATCENFETLSAQFDDLRKLYKAKCAEVDALRLELTNRNEFICVKCGLRQKDTYPRDIEF